MKEQAGVVERTGPRSQDQIVAAVLTLDADATTHVPDARMEEQKGLDEALEEIDKVVVSADMGKLMGEHDLHLLRGQSAEKRHGKENGRANHPHNGGTENPSAIGHARSEGESQQLGLTSQGREDRGIVHGPGISTESVTAVAREYEPTEENGNTEEVETHRVGRISVPVDLLRESALSRTPRRHPKGCLARRARCRRVIDDSSRESDRPRVQGDQPGCWLALGIPRS